MYNVYFSPSTFIVSQFTLVHVTHVTAVVQVPFCRRALGAAKHTHRHRAPPLVGLSVYLDFKGKGRTVM